MASNDGLVLDGIRHSYGGPPVLEGVDLTVGRGEIVCLLGPSGCGKTTTLRVAAGLEAVQTGRVVIDGVEMARPGRSVAPERRHVGLMFQDYALFPHLKVIDNVAFGLTSHRQDERRRIARALLARVGAEGHAEDYPHLLSGGEQQRVALARALAPHPVVMLLDEPFSGLDQRLRSRVRDDTLRLLKEEGVATLLVTHDAEEALYMADRIALMSAGRIVQAGTALELYRKPLTPFVAAFFGELNEFRGRVAGGRVETPLGALAAPFEDGQDVLVLIRPEGLVVANGLREGGLIEARVAETHLLGPATLLRLTLDGLAAPLMARLPGSTAPKAGESIRIRLDPDQSFVFPASKES